MKLIVTCKKCRESIAATDPFSKAWKEMKKRFKEKHKHEGGDNK